MDFKKICLKAEEMYNIDEAQGKAFANYIDTISPWQHPVFIERSPFAWFLDGIKLLNPELEDWLSYYFYECGWEWRIEVEGREYKFNNIEGFIDYLEK